MYSIGQLANLLQQVGFPAEIIPTMAAIGMAESSGNPNAVNNGSGTGTVEYSVGLWQINTRVHKNYSVQQLKDPYINAQEALRIYRMQGLRAWGAYTDGRYKKYLSSAQIPSIDLGILGNVDVYDNNTVSYGALAIGAVLILLLLRD